MYQFIKKYQKRLLALFMVVLMIAFIVPVGLQRWSQVDFGSLPYGKYGDHNLTNTQVQSAKIDIESFIQHRFEPIFLLAEPFTPTNPMQGMSSGTVLSMFRESPETYALLQQEASDAGIVPDADEANSLYTTYFQQTTPIDQSDAYHQSIERFLKVRDLYQLKLSNLKITLPQIEAAIASRQTASFNVLEVKADSFLNDIPNPSESQVQTTYNTFANRRPSGFAATQPVEFGYLEADKVKLQYLQLPREEALAAVVKSLPAAELDPLNRVAFRYYQANESEFQTRPSTPQSQPASTEASATQASTTQASDTQPAATQTAASQASTSKPTAAGEPKSTTRPFGQVLADIRVKVLTEPQPPSSIQDDERTALKALQSKVNDKVADLGRALQERLQSDYAKAHPERLAAGPAAPSTQPAEPTSAPATGPADGVASLDYLNQVADDFAKQYGVRPLVVSRANAWLTQSDLFQLPGISQSQSPAGSFLELATKHAAEEPATLPATPTSGPAASPTTEAASQPATSTTTGPASTGPSATGPATAESPTTVPTLNLQTTPAKSALAMSEPSPLLRSGDGDAFVFRLVEFQGSHVPALADIHDRIVKDLKMTQAYALAMEKAKQLREAAVSASNRPEGGLPSQAEVAGMKAVTTESLNPNRMGGTIDLPEFGVVEPQSREIGLLMVSAKPDNPHPSQILPQPQQQRVLVVELRQLERPWEASQDEMRQSEARTDALAGLLLDGRIATMRYNWFKPSEVATRMKFQKAK